MLAAAGYQYLNPDFSRPLGYDQAWARLQPARQAKRFLSTANYFYRPLDLLGICLGAS